MRESVFWQSVWADFRYALRALAAHPGFTAAAIVALALAIGANVTVFTLANAYLFKNLPFDDSERVVYISSINRTRPGGSRGVSYPDFLDFKAQAKSFEGMAVLTTGTVDLSDGVALPERFRSALLAADGFAVIGQRALRGRDFRPGDDAPGVAPVVILSHGVWQRRYGLDPAIIGRTVRINDVPTEVIGVMPPALAFPNSTELWMPLVRPPAMQRRDARTLTMFGRLAAGGSLRGAAGELDTIARRLAADYAGTNKDIGVLVQNFNDRFNGGDTARIVVWLLWAVALVLLIACANVANLLLARASARSREMSIRTTLGASRGRVVRQLLVESLVLAGAGGALGWLLGVWGVQVFDASLVPAVKPAHIDFTVDYRVVLYSLAITFGTGIAFGLAPALHVARADINTAIKEGGGVAGQSPRARFVSAVLVIAEVALAVILLAGAGLMVRSLVKTNHAEIGVDTKNVLSLNVNLRRTKYPRVEDRSRFYDELKTRLESLPGVAVVAVASDLPAESPDTFDYEADGGKPIDPEDPPAANGLIVSDDYFAAMGVRPRSGRAFGVADGPSGAPAVIVNESLARQAWPGHDAVGRRLRVLAIDGEAQGTETAPPPWLTVVGVVPDILQDDESFELAPGLYLPYRQHPQGGMEIMVRTRVAPGTLGEAIRREVQALDPDLAVRTLRPLEESLWLRNWRYRIFGSMFGAFALIALVLASVGLYAVISQSVNQRVREIGVRLTLGATAASILGLVFRQGLTRLALGLVIGLAGAFASTRVLESLLVGVTPADPLTFIVVSAVLLVSGLLGCAIPARRAIRVDPLIALRSQ